MSFGIALSGGGCRGAAHVGVLMALEENNLFPTSFAGTSAGSIVSGMYAAGVPLKKMKELVLDLTKTGNRMIDADLTGLTKAVYQFIAGKPVTFSGLIKGDRFEKLFREYTGGKNIKDANMRVVLPCVDLYGGYTVAYTNTLNRVTPVDNVQWKTDVPMSEAMMASSAVPGVFMPRTIGRNYLVDGGVSYFLPVDLLIATGEKNVLAVDLADPYQQLDRENIIEVLSRSFTVMSLSLRDCMTKGELFTIAPRMAEQGGLLSFDRMTEYMEAGYKAAMEAMPQLKKVL